MQKKVNKKLTFWELNSRGFFFFKYYCCFFLLNTCNCLSVYYELSFVWNAAQCCFRIYSRPPKVHAIFQLYLLLFTLDFFCSVLMYLCVYIGWGFQLPCPFKKKKEFFIVNNRFFVFFLPYSIICLCTKVTNGFNM